MKVLHYVDDNVLSWAQPWIQTLTALRELGCESAVVCHPGGTLSELMRGAGFPVRLYRPLFPTCPWLSLGLKNIIGIEAPDIIHTRLSSAARLGGWQGARLSLPVVATVDKFPKVKYYERATHLLPCSTSVADHMASLGFARRDMTVVYNSIDVVRYARDEGARRELRRSLSLTDQTVVFLGMGRFVDWKGFDDLVRAFALFLRGRDGDFRLWLLGDGEERPALETLTEELGVVGRIRFWGFIEDVRPYLWGADVYAHPSWGEEAFGLSLLEAMAAGLPCVASESGGMPEILSGGAGLLFPKRDVTNLAQRMEEAAAEAPRLGPAALNRAWDFDVSTVARQTLAVYEKVLARKTEVKVRFN